MSATHSREVRLASRPEGLPNAENFEVAEIALPEPREGEVLVRNLWMSVDPYMRGRMRDMKSYAAPFQIGAPMQGHAIGKVLASRHAGFSPGDTVSSMNGWREAFVNDGAGLEKIDATLAPPEAYLGVLGMPGMTAYVGLTRIGELKDGETVFVSAASGAVGAVACQIAKARGCTVVGTAGSDEKCTWLEREAGIDKAINYRSAQSLVKEVAAACPRGVDVYFENVGGSHLQALLHVMRPFGRIALCGMIEQYNDTAPRPGPNNLVFAVGKSLKLQGFIVSNHADLAPAFRKEVGTLVREGRIKWKQTVFEGIEAAPQAFLSLFDGSSFGKVLVRLAADGAV